MTVRQFPGRAIRGGTSHIDRRPFCEGEALLWRGVRGIWDTECLRRSRLKEPFTNSLNCASRLLLLRFGSYVITRQRHAVDDPRPSFVRVDSVTARGVPASPTL